MFTWFTGRRRPPEWSAVGARVRDLLTNDVGGWRFENNHYRIRHSSGVSVTTSKFVHSTCVVDLGTRTLDLPAWEGNELRGLARPVYDVLFRAHELAREREVLAQMGVTRPRTFTDTARALAWAVLRGEEAAAYALADEVIEYANRPQTPDAKEAT